MGDQDPKQANLHGSAPDNSKTVFLLIDVINDFDYPDGRQLLKSALLIAPRIRALKGRARKAGIPAIFVNDNFGRWQSNFEQLLKHCLEPDSRGRDFVRDVAPGPEDYFVLKPKNSGFYQTPLDILLKHLGTRRVILAGLSANICVLFTAHDAYMRDLELYIPSDCSAAASLEQNRYAMEQMRVVLKADISPSDTLDLDALAGKRCVRDASN